MYFDPRAARKLVGWAAVLLAIVPSAFCFERKPSAETEFCEVTGHMTRTGKPLNDMTLCLDSAPGVHCACAVVHPDGSFRVQNMIGCNNGTAPGRYHAHLYTHVRGPAIPPKYRDPRTSGLEIEIGPDWNEVAIDLP